MSKLRHVGIEIIDVKKAMYFYCKLLGFKLIGENREREMLKDLDFTWYKLAGEGDCLLELYKCHNDNNGFINESVNHIAITVKNIEELNSIFIKKNITRLTPIIVEKSGKKILFCKDYDDNMIELVEEPSGKS